MSSTNIKAVHIYKVRHLENIDIPVSEGTKKNLILTGKNGSGKTSVLNALVQKLEYLIGDKPTKEVCERQVAAYYQMLKHEPTTEIERRDRYENEKNLEKWKNNLSFFTQGASIEFDSVTEIKEKYESGEFIIAYFGDVRKIEVEISKHIQKIDLKSVYSIKEHPSRELAKYMVNLKTTEAFAKTSGQNERAEEIGRWFERFEKLLQNIYDEPSLKLKFDIEDYHFSICMDNREPFDFNTMSMGYAAIFDIISDLMIRMEHKKRYDLEGVVLIDEIETHLHVELQKKILPILSELFPNLQFIITTHSPFVLSSAKDSVVYDLEKHMLVQEGLTNLPYSGIVEGYFEVDTLSKELRDKYEKYKEILTKETLENEDYAELEELEMYLDEIPDYLALDFISDYNRLKLESYSRLQGD